MAQILALEGMADKAAMADYRNVAQRVLDGIVIIQSSMEKTYMNLKANDLDDNCLVHCATTSLRHARSHRVMVSRLSMHEWKECYH